MNITLRTPVHPDCDVVGWAGNDGEPTSFSPSSSSLASSLANDESEFALRPRDPEAFDRLVADMGELLDEPTPVNTPPPHTTASPRAADRPRASATPPRLTPP